MAGGIELGASIAAPSRSLVDVYSSGVDGASPGKREEHDSRASESADADAELLLRVVAEAGEEDDGAVGNGSEDRQDNRPYEILERRDEEKQLAALTNHVGLRGRAAERRVGKCQLVAKEPGVRWRAK